MKAAAVNAALAAAIGIDPKRCTGFDLRVRVGELPALSVHTLMIDADGVHSEEGLFDLTLRPLKFDLDRACKEAIARLERAVEQSAARALVQLSGRRIGLGRAGERMT